MPRRLTQKQTMLVFAYIKCGNKSEAYRQSYNVENMLPATINKKAVFELDKGHVRASLDELRAAQAKRLDVTVESLTIEYEEARQVGLKHDQSAAMSTATTGKGTLHGLVRGAGAEVADVGKVFLEMLKEMNKARLAGNDIKLIEG